jgi:hypothetical protein
VLVPVVEEALRSQDKLRLLYLLGDDVTGFPAGAAWQDAKVGMEHVSRCLPTMASVIVDHGRLPLQRGPYLRLELWVRPLPLF